MVSDSQPTLHVTIGILLIAILGIGEQFRNKPAPVEPAPHGTPFVQPATLRSVAAVQGTAPSKMINKYQCQGCHTEQVKDWQGSHHQLAIHPANADTLLGDFNNVTFKAENETTRFSRKGDEFWVNATGIDGKNADFKVAYTFGIAPLQQYLIEVGEGRLQALGVAWDTEKHRWFHLYPARA